MASGRRGPSGTARTPGARQKRPPPTIDLKATEVASEPVREPAAEPTPAPTSEPSPDPSVLYPAAEPEPEPHLDHPAAAAEPEAPPNGHAENAFARALRGWLPDDQPRVLLAGGAAGVGVMLLLFAVMWLAGAFTPRAAPDRSAALAEQIGALESQIRDLIARPAPRDQSKTIGDLAARLDAVDANLRRLDEIGARLLRIETALAAPRPATTDPAVLDRIAAAEAAALSLAAGIAELRQRIDEAAAAAREARGRADAAAEKADKAAGRPVAPAVERGEVDTLAARIAAIERAQKAIDEQLGRTAAAGPGADRVVRLAFTATALRAAVERGTPFTAELAALRALGVDNATLAPLDPFAATGVPTTEALARDLGKLGPALLGAAGTPPREGGFIEKLQQNAERLVRIRPVGETPGDEPAVIVARADAKASRGDLAGAIAELDKLPPMVKAPAAPWMRTAQARIAAVDAARQLAAGALDALNKPAP